MRSTMRWAVVALLMIGSQAVAQTAAIDAKTAEMFNVLVNDPDETRALQLIKGVNINAMNADGQTLLMVASRSKKLQVVEALIDAGADLTIMSKRGYPTMFFVSSTNRGTILEKAVRRGGKLDVRGHDGTTMLHWVCAEGQLSAMRYLLAQKVDINARTTDGATPLIFAAERGKEKVVQELLAAGADMKLTVKFDNNSEEGLQLTAYQVAVRERKSEVAEILRQAMGLPKPPTLTTTLEGDPW